MEHSKLWNIEQDHGTDWYTDYQIEIFGDINPGSRGDYITPGEPTFVDGCIRIEVRSAVDYRFGDNGCPLNLIAAGVTEKQAGEWLLKQLSEDEINSLSEVLLEDWSERQDELACRW